jgi:FixJ family two-component response regulator
VTRRPDVVFIVDDDDGVRDGLCLLVGSAGFEARPYPSADAFLADYAGDVVGCLLLDLNMPGTDGLELQTRLAGQGCDLPVIFLTGTGDVPAAVRALKGGAMDFLQKPVSDSQVLLDLVGKAAERHRTSRRQREERRRLNERLTSLTGREREVLERVVAGQANKVIAIDLGISERTVEIHRSRVMRKLGARSVAELIGVYREVVGG